VGVDEKKTQRFQSSKEFCFLFIEWSSDWDVFLLVAFIIF